MDQTKKLLGDLVLSLLATIVLLSIGLMVVIQSGTAIKARPYGRVTLTVASPASDPTGNRDWETADAPGASADTVLPTSVCPSPSASPASSPDPIAFSNSSSGHVLGERSDQPLIPDAGEAEDNGVLIARAPTPTHITTCNEGYIANGPNNYSLSSPIREIEHEPVVPGNTAREIMEAICDGDPSPPSCQGTGDACAWWSIEGDVRFIGLLDENIGIYEFTSGDVYPNGLSGESISVPAIYPDAPLWNDALDVVFNMETWKLAAESEEILRAVDERLVDIANTHIVGLRTHELGHWNIFNRYVSRYIDGIINDPPVPGGYYYSPEEAVEAFLDAYYEKWAEVEKEEDQEHAEYETSEGYADEGEIPIPGFEGIDCIGIESS